MATRTASLCTREESLCDNHLAVLRLIGLVDQLGQELPPSTITDVFSESPVPDHAFNIQVLNSYCGALVYKVTRELMLKV
jgi:hypothetical protein